MAVNSTVQWMSTMAVFLIIATNCIAVTDATNLVISSSKIQNGPLLSPVEFNVGKNVTLTCLREGPNRKKTKNDIKWCNDQDCSEASLSDVHELPLNLTMEWHNRRLYCIDVAINNDTAKPESIVLKIIDLHETDAGTYEETAIKNSSSEINSRTKLERSLQTSNPHHILNKSNKLDEKTTSTPEIPDHSPGNPNPHHILNKSNKLDEKTTPAPEIPVILSDTSPVTLGNTQIFNSLDLETLLILSLLFVVVLLLLILMVIAIIFLFRKRTSKKNSRRPSIDHIYEDVDYEQLERQKGLDYRYGKFNGSMASEQCSSFRGNNEHNEELMRDTCGRLYTVHEINQQFRSNIAMNMPTTIERQERQKELDKVEIRDEMKYGYLVDQAQ